MYQTLRQLPQVASVSFSLRDKPVRRSEAPPVKNAPVAFPPLMPLFTFTFFVRTRPLVWQ